MARRNPSKARDLGLFSVPFFLCLLSRMGTHFWRIFLGGLFVANPLPPTPFRNLRQPRCAPPCLPFSETYPPPLFSNKNSPPFRLELLLPFPAPETEEKIKNIRNGRQACSSSLLERFWGQAKGDTLKVTEPNLRFPAKIFSFLRKSVVFCGFLRPPNA